MRSRSKLVRSLAKLKRALAIIFRSAFERNTVIAVADIDGTLLAVFRTTDATIFSIDVAVAKSRNVIYFSSPDRGKNTLPDMIREVAPKLAGTLPATYDKTKFNGGSDLDSPLSDLPGVVPGTIVTNRTISFGAQPLFPPGLDYSGYGPFYNLFLYDTANPCTQGADPNNKANQSGIVFFPGAVPLFKDGKMVGGFGISGDGVDQDDFVTVNGAMGFEAPLDKLADRVFIKTPLGNVRLPYTKFPRNPML